MNEFSVNSRADIHTVSQSAGALAGLLENLRQERSLLMPEKEPVEGQVLAPTWGRWPW